VVVLRETIIQACEDSDVGLPGVDVDRDSSLGNYFQARAFRSQQLRKSKRDISYFLESPRSQQSLAKVCDAWGDTLQDIVLASYTGFGIYVWQVCIVIVIFHSRGCGVSLLITFEDGE
jgi:hypothetical protein